MAIGIYSVTGPIYYPSQSLFAQTHIENVIHLLCIVNMQIYKTPQSAMTIFLEVFPDELPKLSTWIHG